MVTPNDPTLVVYRLSHARVLKLEKLVSMRSYITYILYILYNNACSLYKQQHTPYYSNRKTLSYKIKISETENY